VENAKLGQVPLFLGILSLLFGEDTSRHYFDELRMRFGISDGQFIAQSGGIEILSPAVNLLGAGTMDFAGNLDLLFETRIVDVRIPVVEQIFALIQKGFAQIAIGGNLSAPQVEFLTGGGIVRFDLDSGKAVEIPPPNDDSGSEDAEAQESASPTAPAPQGDS